MKTKIVTVGARQQGHTAKFKQAYSNAAKLQELQKQMKQSIKLTFESGSAASYYIVKRTGNNIGEIIGSDIPMQFLLCKNIVRFDSLHEGGYVFIRYADGEVKRTDNKIVKMEWLEPENNKA